MSAGRGERGAVKLERVGGAPVANNRVATPLTRIEAAEAATAEPLDTENPEPYTEDDMAAIRSFWNLAVPAEAEDMLDATTWTGAAS